MIQQFQFWVFTQRKQNTNLKRYMNVYVLLSTGYSSQDMETM